MSEWFDVKGYEARYQVTRDGRVKSKIRRVYSPICGGDRQIGGKLLKLVTHPRGYRNAQFVVDGKRKSLSLHRMLAELFIPNPEGKPHINHIDGNPANNSIENLEWCTHLENMRHAYATGLAKAPVNGPGEASPAAKLTDEKVRDIKRRLLAGETHKAIAKIYGVASGTIGFISVGVTWSHVGP